ncbi:MAG: D-alanyl-D-alanine carboxypeptidase [Clostridia bacterium]|nr:D-alanyl-D-alanine carboxypeptidase [Clostridia bacterium]
MKKIIAVFFAILFTFSLSAGAFAESVEINTAENFAKSEKDPIYDITLDSQGVYVFNPETGTAIYEKASDSRMYPASTTKIMTTLVILEMCEDPKNTTVTVDSMQMFDYIINDGGVHMGLVRGETFTVYDLLVGTMMASYCDAPELLAHYFGNGDISSFIQKMNDRAAEMGLKNTHFENAHGLHSNNHYSSPKDMAMILWEAVQNPTFREIISLRSYTIPATGYRPERNVKPSVGIFLESSDYYLDAYVGGKSGYTGHAGRCLATYSETEDLSFVSVLFGANMDPDRHYPGYMSNIETHTLISYAIENFEIRTVLEKGAPVGNVAITDSEATVPVIAGEEIRVLNRKGNEPSFSMDLPTEISVSEVENNKEIGKALLSFNGKTTESAYPLLLSWDGVPIATKSFVEKGAERAAYAIAGIFREDRVFVILLILLLTVVAICIPAFRITCHLHKKKSHKPKH